MLSHTLVEAEAEGVVVAGVEDEGERRCPLAR